ncbi:VOC family protein [Flavobacterium pedocola]
MQLLEVHLLTDSLRETEFFYKEKLGFKVVEQTDELLCFEVGISKLWFHQTERLQKPVYHFAFDIPENQLEEGLEWVRSKAELIPYEKDKFIVDFSNWNAKSFYFYDNNGNILEGIVRYDLLNICNNSFDANSFLKISEIGFAVLDVLTFCDEVNFMYGTDFFEKQPKRENFSVLGDDHGLFIVSSLNRHWYPTEQTAISFWTKVIFEMEGKVFQLSFE